MNLDKINEKTKKAIISNDPDFAFNMAMRLYKSPALVGNRSFNEILKSIQKQTKAMSKKATKKQKRCHANKQP